MGADAVAHLPLGRGGGIGRRVRTGAVERAGGSACKRCRNRPENPAWRRCAEGVQRNGTTMKPAIFYADAPAVKPFKQPATKVA